MVVSGSLDGLPSLIVRWNVVACSLTVDVRLTFFGRSIFVDCSLD